MGKKSFFSILFIIAGIIVAGCISYFAFKENRRNKQIENEINSLRVEAENLRQNNQEMIDKISYFDSSEYQEKVAKEKLNLQKEDESVTVIKPSLVLQNNQTEENRINTKEIVAEKPNYEKWWEYFFKY